MRAARVVRQLRRAGCVFAEDEARLLEQHAAETGEPLEPLVQRRCAGEPLEYIVGWAAFCGVRVAVSPGVFVPRRRTEFLARVAAIFARYSGADATVLDLCCGAGAITAVLQAEVPDIRLYAVDLDPAAVECARTNVGDDVHLFVGDLYEPLPAQLRGRVDVVVANAPYVPTEDIAAMPAEARDHEQRTALDGGADGTDVARRVFDGARHWLRPGGTAFVELSGSQAVALSPNLDADLDVCITESKAYAEIVLSATAPGGADAADREQAWDEVHALLQRPRPA
ncbi:putative protein N(5)-glutamine methyltransferase [uncultured Jatrophihabitans sp.]|uniref:putative protein N(5)-glutamine methyltransferase n=1 Tax=uncultured Jatrophihabitans sp. TaxID=1610747 RepID=UPI0035CC1052